jgi:hypothetical protein
VQAIDILLLWHYIQVSKTTFELEMKKRELKKKGNAFIRQLLNKDLRTLIIQAGFPYHKSPHLYQWLWVFILLPFLPEDTLNELSYKHGNELHRLYQILVKYPHSFEKLVGLLAIPLFFERLEEFSHSFEANKVAIVFN